MNPCIHGLLEQKRVVHYSIVIMRVNRGEEKKYFLTVFSYHFEEKSTETLNHMFVLGACTSKLISHLNFLYKANKHICCRQSQQKESLELEVFNCSPTRLWGTIYVLWIDQECKSFSQLKLGHLIIGNPQTYKSINNSYHE